MVIGYLVLGVFCCFVASVCLIISWEFDNGFFILAMIVLLLIGACSFYGAVDSKRSSDVWESIQAEKDDYKVYLDGNEVEWDNLDFDMYKVKVDTEKKVVYCSRKLLDF